MAGHDIIVIGTSAGGVEALKELVKSLPADLPAAIFVVIHLSADSKNLLASILDHNCALRVVTAKDNLAIETGQIYIAPSDHHLIIQTERMRLSHGPKENLHRPAVDPLFRSAARIYGSRVIGVILTGNLDDGTSGLQAVKSCGGISVVQDPADAAYESMPRNAIENVQVDHCLPLAQLGALLAELVKLEAPNGNNLMVPQSIDIEAAIAEKGTEGMEEVHLLGKPSPLTCPDCHGVLWEMQDKEVLRYRCQVGHAFSADSLQFEQHEDLESSLWAAVRALEEVAAMNRRLSIRARERNSNSSLAARFEEKAATTEQHASLIRQILLDNSLILPENENSETMNIEP